MKKFFSSRGWGLWVWLALGVVPVSGPLLVRPLAAADGVIRFEPQPGTKVRIEGSSTVHAWTVDGNIIAGFMEVDSGLAALVESTGSVPNNVKAKVEASVPVRSLKSGKKPMDNVMYEALKLDQFQRIDYRLISLVPKGKKQFEATGALTVSGVTRTNKMMVTVEPVDTTRFKVSGVANLKMTDFGIKPPAPTLGLGLIKTDDEVKVSFDWPLALRAPAAAKTP
jgi:hypothetical protein